MPQRSSPRVSMATLVWLLAVSPAGAGSGAVGVEFQVNTFTLNSQRVSSSAADAAGGLVVAWQSGGQDGSGEGVFGQRYDVTGSPLGAEFQVNTTTAGSQSLPAIASDSAGNLVVVWEDPSLDGSGRGVFGQRYDSLGNTIGGEFQVNTTATANQDTAAIASDAAGNFVVVWRDDALDGSGFGVFGQRYSSAGNPVGGEFQVNTNTTGGQLNPSVASDTAGNFVVVWQDDSQDGSDSGIYGQRYNAAGSPLGLEFQVNTFTTGPQRDPSIASDSTGDFVVVWRSDGQDGSGRGVYAQRYDNLGNQLGSEFRVNTFTAGDQSRGSVAVDAVGNFTVTWTSDVQDGSGNGVFGQRYDSAGGVIGTEFQVNAFTAGGQTGSSVTALASGIFIVTWSSFLQDGSSDGVFGRSLATLFADGFESGDTAAWGTTVP